MNEYGTLTWSASADAIDRLCVMQTLERRDTILNAEWPVDVPETYRAPTPVIATWHYWRTLPAAPWVYWGVGPPDAQGRIFRAPAGTPVPPGAEVARPDSPVSDEERRREIARYGNLGAQVPVDIDDSVRRSRGDPWFETNIHAAPLTLDAEKAQRAALSCLTSEHAIAWVRPCIDDTDSATCRWRGGIGIGSHEIPVPGSFRTATEAEARARALWRYHIAAAVRAIHTARGGTLTAWGVPVLPRATPRLLRAPARGDLWSLFAADKAADRPPRSGLEMMCGLHPDGSPIAGSPR